MTMECMPYETSNSCSCTSNSDCGPGEKCGRPDISTADVKTAIETANKEYKEKTGKEMTCLKQMDAIKNELQQIEETLPPSYFEGKCVKSTSCDIPIPNSGGMKMACMPFEKNQ
jgi:hypothetical protein